MAVAQFTLWGTQCQWLIARCILDSSLFAPYLSQGKILFKGSSTVSCLTALLADTPMRICGRITKNGMKRSYAESQGAHFLLYERGEIRNVDSCLEQTLQAMGPDDLFVTGANALDAFGHAALLIGSSGGGGYGTCMPFLYTEGIRTLILTSVMKLIPGDLTRLNPQISRKKCDFSYGMACSLAPIPGEVLTEAQAIESYARVNALVFAKGGFSGAEASVAIQIEGEQEEVEKVLHLVEQIKALPSQPPVDADSFAECTYPCSGCSQHRSCAYANKQTIFHSIKMS